MTTETNPSQPTVTSPEKVGEPSNLRNPAFDGPMGIFADYEGCESGMDTTPTIIDPDDQVEHHERWSDCD